MVRIILALYQSIISTKNALRHQSVTIIFKTDNYRFMNRHQIIHAHTIIKTNLNAFGFKTTFSVSNDLYRFKFASNSGNNLLFRAIFVQPIYPGRLYSENLHLFKSNLTQLYTVSLFIKLYM